ncbi:Protein transport protein SEC13 [Fasciola gigantica]|uniref:Protein transport protein SEC13 n=1 Tax=Fasciola gigantica TaxID=46835 RepID=A0A504YZ19_FASGI|nr:Protein transport protein SEC13 [Fasciola gigantica]
MGLASVVLVTVSFLVNTGVVRMWALLSMAFILGVTVFGTVSLCGVLAVELVPPSLSGTCHALTALAANVGAFLACSPMTWLSSQIGWPGTFMCSGMLGLLSVIPLCAISSMRRLHASSE